MKRSNNLRFTTAAGLVAALFFSIPINAQDTVRLQGHVLGVLPSAVHLTRSPQSAQESITLTLMLNWSDPTGFDAYRKAFEDPSSPGYRKHLKADELKARFGPSQNAYDTVLAWLRQNGFTLTEGSDNRLTITVTGTRAQAERAFGVTIDDYLMGSRQFHAIDTDPALPAALAPLVRSVSGLSNLAEARPAGSPQTPQATAQAYNGALTPAGTLPGTGPGVLPPGINGTGQTIALIEFDSFNPADVSFWLSQAGLPASLINQVTTVPVNGGTSPSGCNIAKSGCGEGEVLLDIAAALGVAPGANVAVMVAKNGTNDIDSVNSAVNYLNKGPGGGGVISDSWSKCEAETSSSDNDSMDTLLSTAYIYGQSFFASTGDTGSTCVSPQGSWANSISFPANAPHAVAVGGTVLQTASSGSYGSEAWWNTSTPGKFGTSSFGLSQHFARPSWQDTFTTSSQRSVPDVVAYSAPGVFICQNSNCIGVQGTSLSAPIWAGVWALASQAENLAQGSVGDAQGFMGTPLVPGLNSPAGMTGPNNDFAHLGLGSPNIASVASLVAGIPSVSGVSPASGPMTGGTTVTIDGHAFIGVTKVLFGGVPATSFTVDAESQITAISPAIGGQPVSVDIVVQTPAGASSAFKSDQFKYLATVTGVTPNSGPLTGFTAVTVTGAGFATGVNANAPFFFGGVAATNVQCSTSTHCTMLNPAHAVATVNVTYTGEASGTVQFTYNGPTLTSISPNVGGENGGTQVTLVGTGLSQGMKVNFGNTSVGVNCAEPDGQNLSVTSCTASSPAGVGAVHVSFTVNGVTTLQSTADIFTYQPLPFGNLSVTQGSYLGGTAVTVTGGNFNTASGATQFSFVSAFGSVPAANVKCSSTKVCTLTTPPLGNSAGAVVQITATANGFTGAIGPFDYIGVPQKGSGKQPPCVGTCQ